MSNSDWGSLSRTDRMLADPARYFEERRAFHRAAILAERKAARDRLRAKTHTARFMRWLKNKSPLTKGTK